MNHLLEFALETARAGGWNEWAFVVPATREGERFGLKPGRYLFDPARGKVNQMIYPHVMPGDLRLH